MSTIELPTTMTEAEAWIEQAVFAYEAKEGEITFSETGQHYPEADFTAIDDLVEMLNACGRKKLAQKVVKMFDLDW